MGTRLGTPLLAIWLGVTMVTMAPVGSWTSAATAVGADWPGREPVPARLVPIEMQPPAPLPRLVPITLSPQETGPALPPRQPVAGTPPLVAISYSPAQPPASASIMATPPTVVPAPPLPLPLPPPLPVIGPPSVVAAAPLPVLPPTASLPPPLPVLPPTASLPPPLPVLPPTASLPPPLPVLAQGPMQIPPLPVQEPLPVQAPAPLPVPQSQAQAQPQAQPQPQPSAVAAAPMGGKPNDAIRIASFNIQVFGEAKIAKHQVVDVLARVVRNFDIVAVQEVRAKSDSVIPQFVSAINADGSRYQFVIGPRLGRTVSKEQYTFIYDSTRIEVDPTSVGTSPNPGDRLHRPPLHARFRVRSNSPQSGFSFWLVDTHTDPDEVSAEVNALADVFLEMKRLRPDEDDVILLGDLNAGPPQFGRLKQIPNVGWAVSGVTTNTRRSKTYDNLIFDARATTEYTGTWGVLDLQSTFGLSLDKALEVSDHNPVWAAFRPWETQQVAAGVPPALTQ